MSTHEKIRQYIESNLVTFDATEAEFTDDDNIFEKGFLNSLFAMQMLTFIETEFDLTVDNDDLDLVNFSTVNNIVRLIEKKQKGRSPA
ncbi:Acyl carrier protein [Marininema mesophilum]|uniref:Acyl carrier protein n=1 Tax=Marininema mesophilum TaxID=1048340 RepID=A0A1H2QAD3_9BACL|nr:phosphopantetheine-binding protein [Marininema mesophilum]SDW04111.1 Acyl carrier protein [Marininema mesophilum]